GLIGFRAFEPVARHRDVYEIGAAGPKRSIVDTELALHARDVIREDDVTQAHELAQQLAATFVAVIERDAALVSIDGQVPERHAVEERRAPLTRVISGSGPFHLDHVRPEISQQLRAVGTGYGGREID